MEHFLNRYRNLTALLVAIVAQLILLAYQVKSDGEARLIHVWAVGAVSPIAKGFDSLISHISGGVTDYALVFEARSENRRLHKELDDLKIENQKLASELALADRAKALALFQKTVPSKLLAARIIGHTPGVASQVAIVDRGSSDGVQKGMGVVTPDGIVGKVTAVFPSSSFVLLISDPDFAAGVVSQKNRAHGTLKGSSSSSLVIDYIDLNQKVEPGEWFYTSGEDRIFPRGFPVGVAKAVRTAKGRQEVMLKASGTEHGLEELLIVIEGVHGAVPPVAAPLQPSYELAPPGAEPSLPAPATGITQNRTDADKVIERYRRIGESTGHQPGAGGVPNYNATLPDGSTTAGTSGAAEASRAQ